MICGDIGRKVFVVMTLVTNEEVLLSSSVFLFFSSQSSFSLCVCVCVYMYVYTVYILSACSLTDSK